MNWKKLFIVPFFIGMGTHIGLAADAETAGAVGIVEMIIGAIAIGCIATFGGLQYFRKKRASTFRRGIVKWFNPNKGFGFIEQEQGEDLFVHRTEIRNRRFRSLNKDDQVEFEIGHGKKGPVAKNVRKIPSKKHVFQQYGRARQASNDAAVS